MSDRLARDVGRSRMSETQNILVVDDEASVRLMLRRFLMSEGFNVTEAMSAAAARTLLERERPDLVLLDVNMPGEDGLTLAGYIHQQFDLPIIMLTGKADLIDRVVGLEMGADDYITKPFHLREVLARVRSVIRRAQRHPPFATTPSPEPPLADTLAFAGWELDLLRRELRRQDGLLVPLSSGEFDLLRVFAGHANQVLSRDRLMNLVKGTDWNAYDRAIDTQVARLRRKIENDPTQPDLIKTIRSAGYMFTAVVTTSATGESPSQ